MKKRINKILWYGSELENGKAKVPSVSVEENGLDGLNEGELYISNNEIDPALFIRTSNSKVVRLGEANYKPFKFEYDESIDALVLSRTDGKPAHFLASGAVATRGLGEIESGGGGTGTGVDLLNVPSDIIPIVGGSYSLGSSTNAWKMIYANGGIIGNTYIDSSRVIFGTYIQGQSWAINPDGSASLGSITSNGETVATRNWVNSQSFAKTSDLTSINNNISSLQASTFTGANAPEGKGYTLTWFTQSGGGRNVTIPAYGEVGTVITDGLAGIGQNVALVDQWLIADLMDYIAKVAAGGNVDLSNYVTLNSAQTISGKKTFTGGITVNNGITASHLYSVDYLDSSELIINAEKVNFTYYGDDADVQIGLINGYKPLTIGNTSFSPALTSGTVIGTITIGGESKTIYAPSGGSADLSNYVTLDGEQTITGGKYFSDLNANSIYLQGFELKPYSLDGRTPDRLMYDGGVLLDEYNYKDYLVGDLDILSKGLQESSPLYDMSYLDYIRNYVSGKNLSVVVYNQNSESESINAASVALNVGNSANRVFRLISYKWGDLYWQKGNGNGDGWDSMRTILDSSNYATHLDSAYIKKSGGTVTGQLTSTVADGTAPFVVASTTEVANLHSATATKLSTPRTLWGQSFDGSGNVSGNLTGVGPNIAGSAQLLFSSTNGSIAFRYNSDDTKSVVLNATQFKPYESANLKLDLGSSSARWKGIYGNTLDLSGSATIGGETVATQVWVNSQNFVNAEGGTINNATLTGDVTGNGWSIEGGIANFGEVNADSLYVGGEEVLTSNSLANYVTLNTEQTISERKTFSKGIIGGLHSIEAPNSVFVGLDSTVRVYGGLTIGTGDLKTPSITSDNVLPKSNSSGNIGTSTAQWLNGYFNSLYSDAISVETLIPRNSPYISVNAMSLDLYECELYGYNSDNLDIWSVDFAGNAYFLSVTQTSDIRYKNIKENVHLKLSDIAAAPTFKFTWANEIDGITHLGTSAQYWQEIAGELVVENKKTGKLGLDYSTAALVSAVSIAREVNTMKMWQTSTTDRIEELEDKVKKLEEENKALRELLNSK